MLSSIDFNREIFVWRLNWAVVLAIAFFWTYGLFGALTLPQFSFIGNVLISLVFAVILIWLIYLGKKDFFSAILVFHLKDLAVLVGSAVFLLIFSLNSLALPLVGDQLAHAQQSQLPVLTLIDWLVGHFDYFSNLPLRGILWIFDLAILAGGLFSIFVFQRARWQWPAVFFGLFFLLSRFAIVFLGGASGPHPPLRLLPLWLTSSVFGPFDFSFRLAQFFGLIIFIWLLQSLAEKRLGFLLSWFLALAAGTMPVIWHVGLLAEQSIWTAILWSGFLVSLFFWPAEALAREKYLLKWICLAAIFTLLRQSAFLILLPLAWWFFQSWRQEQSLTRKNVIYFLSPLLVMVPFLLKSFVLGTPADYQGELPLLGRFWSVLASGTMFNAIANSLDWVWLILFFAGLIFIFCRWRRFWPLAVFFLAALIMFYAITPDLWGLGRYQAEYAAPLAVFGLFGIFLWLKKKGIKSGFSALAAIVLIVGNIIVFSGLAAANAPIDDLRTSLGEKMKELGQYSVLSELPYDYRTAFSAARDAGYTENIFVAGATYGVFSEILNGFSIAEVIALEKIYESVPPLFSAIDLQANKDIELVFISDFFDGDGLRKDLADLGWQEWRNFRIDRYGSTIFSLIRSVENK